MSSKKIYNIVRILLILITILLLNYLINISHFKLDILKNLFNKEWEPKYSIYRPEVFEIKKILTNNKIIDFRFTDNFLNKNYRFNLDGQNKYIYYRVIAYVYPIKHIKESNNFIIFKNIDESHNSCKIIDETSYVKLVKC